jgi:hypothetical protein
MGYSARYHAASLAAVFLALAVGILVGVGFGSDIVNGTANDLQKSLESDLDEARAQVDDLQVQLDSEHAFEQAVFPAVVANQLRAERIALVGLGGLDQTTANDVGAAVDAAGGTLAEVAVVREPPDLEALAGTLAGRRSRAIARGDEEELRILGERSGHTLVRGGPSFDQLRGTLLSRYSGKAENIDGVIVVRQRPETLDPPQETATTALEDGLITGLSAAATTVGAEATDSDPSSIGFFDSHGIATVDSIDRISGRVALVFALSAGASGNFGIKDSADSLLPDLLAPEGGRTQGGRSSSSNSPGAKQG